LGVQKQSINQKIGQRPPPQKLIVTFSVKREIYLIPLTTQEILTVKSNNSFRFMAP
jgi:hypothetical protein